MALVSNPHSAYSPRLPWLGGIAGLLAGGAILYFWPQWNRTWLSLVPAPVSVYTRFLGVTLEDVPLVTYCHQALLGFLMVLLAPGYGKSTLAAWMMHNPASSRRWPGEVFRAWVTKFGLLVIVFCNLFFLSRVPSGTLALYIFYSPARQRWPRRVASGAGSCVRPAPGPHVRRSAGGPASSHDTYPRVPDDFAGADRADERPGREYAAGLVHCYRANGRGVTGVYAGRRAGGSATFSAGRREVPGLARGYGALQRHCHTVRDGISPLSHGVCLSANLCRPALAFATPLLCLDWKQKETAGAAAPAVR